LVIDNVAAALEDRYPASAFIVIGFMVMVSNPQNLDDFDIASK